MYAKSVNVYGAEKIYSSKECNMETFSYDYQAFSYHGNWKYFVVHCPGEFAITYFAEERDAVENAAQRSKTAKELGLSCFYVVMHRSMGNAIKKEN